MSKLSPEQRAMLEKRLAAAQSAPQAEEMIPKRSDEGPVRLSFAQQRLWVLDQLDEGTAAYNMPFAVRLTGGLHVEALEATLNAIIERHATLRTTFAKENEDGQPVQVIARELRLPLTVIDLRGLSQAEQDAETKRRLLAETETPFDLSQGPLIRFSLLQLQENEHILLLSMHHIISDGWSITGVFLKEFAALYGAFSAGQPSPLAELPIQYADFAAWQRERLSGSAFEEQLSYWKRQLADVTALQLPTDHPRPPVQTHSGAQERFALSRELTATLHELSKRHGASLFMTLLAAFQAVLSRYTGQEDIAVGTPIAGRTRKETEGLIGFFVGTLVMRGDLSNNPTFDELIERVKKTALQAYDHQDVPFDQLVNELQVERDMSRSPLFQVMFTLQNAPMSSVELPGLTIAALNMESITAKFDLELLLNEAPDGLVGHLKYNTDLFEQDTIQRMTAHLQTFLAAAASNPTQPLADLPLVPQAEQELLAKMGTGAEAASEQSPLCTHELFAEQAQRTPDNVAVLFEDRQLTYRELDQRANQTAHYLRSMGAGPDTLIGLYVDRSEDLVIGLLAILKSGAAYVPIDTAYPSDRVALILEDTAAPLLLTESHLLAQLPEHQAKTVCLDTELAQIANLPHTAPDSGVTPEHLAYMIYTSGSTGRPKAVMVEHRNLVSVLQTSQQEFGFGNGDVMPWIASAAFDIALFELMNPLLCGGTSAVLTKDHVLDIERLAADLQTYTAIHTVPSLMRQIVEGIRAAGLSAAAFDNLRLIFIGGDAVPPDLLTAMYEVFQNAQIHVLYGPTEGTIICSQYAVPRGAKMDRLHIGRPLLHATLRVCDPSGQLQPVGIPGELLIGGPGVTRGYYRQAELTAEKYIEADGLRWYKTGDLVRWHADGTLEFLGRIDHQVKIRGFRIELGEIETVLAQHKALKETLVTVHEDEHGEKRLAAYVVPEAGEEIVLEDLRGHLRERLPEYMIPAAFVVLDAMPLNQNGKIDRKKLPAPELTRAETSADYSAPRTATEQALAEIWSSVLRLERVGIHDNFFALGGDSILSIQIIHRANQQGIRLKPKDLFQNQTIARLAEAARLDGGEETLAEQGAVTGPVLLTPVQQWFFEQEFADMHHFNMSLLFELQEPLDQAVMRGVINDLLSHHDALRMRFVRTADGWEQFAVAEGDVPFTEADFSDLPLAEQDAAFATAAAEWQAGLSLSEGPLVSFVHATFGGERAERLLIIVHHLLIDGVSWRILLQDLETAYEQRLHGQAVQLPLKTTSFQKWAELLNAHAQSDAVLQEKAYWAQLQEANLAALPTDHADGDNLTGSAGTVSVLLSPEETQRLLQEAPKAYRTQINDLLLTAWAEAFGAWTGERSLLLAMESHGREDLFDNVDTSRTVGWFTATYPVHLQLPVKKERGSAVQAVKEQLRAVPNRGIGFGLLQNELGEIAHPQVSYNYLGQFDQGGTSGDASRFTLSGAPSGANRSPRMKRSHLLEINGVISGGQLRMSITYSENVHHRATIDALAQSFLRELQGITEHCATQAETAYTPSDFPLAQVSQTELNTLFEELQARGVKGERVEQIYPLSPMQQGMLYHSLLEQGSGVYVTQVNAALQGDLKADALLNAWQTVIERHPILRTSFHTFGGRDPLQAVLQGVEMPLTTLDWQTLNTEQQAAELEAFLSDDRAKGFDLSCAPLMRLAVIRTGADTHRLIWTSHHLLLDGWSMPLVFKEVFSLYDAYAGGQELALSPSRPYSDFIEWLSAQDINAAKAYWQQQLKGFSEPALLGVERQSAVLPQGEKQFEEQRATLSPDATIRLQALAKQHQLTLNTLVQGAWTIVLQRYSGAEDIAFGATVSGRPAELDGVEAMVGLFINTLPVRSQLTAASDVLSSLQALQARQAEVRDFEYTPLSLVQAWSGLPHDQPLFHSILVFENYPMDQELAEDVGAAGSLQITEMGTGELSHYPLTIGVAPGKQLAVKIAYDRLRYEDRTIELLHGHLMTVLSDLLARPGQRVQDVRMNTPQEQTLFTEWGSSKLLVPPSVSTHRLFEEQAAKTPDAIAVQTSATTLTYRELNARANRLARHLQTLGVGPEVRVTLLVERSAELVVAVLGILKAGGAYVPLDTAYPEERMRMILEDSGAKVMVTQSDLLDKLPAIEAQILCLDTAADKINRQDGHDLPEDASPHSLAYMIYTSGSTGRPKAVMVEHHNLVSVLQASQNAFGFTSGDTMPWIASVAFDIALFELMNPLLSGGTSVVMTREEVLDLPKLTASLQNWTMIHTVPSLMRQIVQTAEENGIDAASFDALRTIYIGGDAVPPDLLDAMHSVFRNAQIHVLYGPTEGTIICSHFAVPRDVKMDKFYIGRALPHVHLRICDPQQQAAPLGVPGELLIGGYGVSRGYFLLESLTQEKFVDKDGLRWYRTGDLVRYTADGTIEFLGRLDNQVKIRGFRIELGEIETALNSVEDVQEAVVIATAAGGEKRLIAYVVAEEAQTLTVSALRTALQERLPEYMIPSAFVMLDQLPLNPNGKVDRRALPAPDASLWETASDAAARTPLEEMVAGIWAEVLGRPQVGIYENFFEAGGHSLLVTQVVSRINEVFGLDLQLRALFEAPTVAELAEHVQTLQQASHGMAVTPIEIISRDGDLPLSFAQHRLWVLDQLNPGTTVYNMPFAVRLVGSLNIAALERTLTEIVRRHEALRTTFDNNNGEALQKIAAPYAVSLPVLDWSGEEASAREAAAKRYVEQEALTPFDLSQGPLLRSSLLKLNDEEHVLVLNLHHIVSDGWSMGVFLQEVAALYGAFHADQPAPLAELPVQYADFAAWQRGWLQGDVYDKQLSYWKEQLSGELPVLQLPADHPRPPVQTYRGAIVQFQVEGETVKHLQQLSRRAGSTMFMTLLAAYQVLLMRYSGQEDITVGTPIAGRNRKETEHLIGFFVNTLVLRTDLSGDPTFEELLSRVRETALGAYAHQDLPFEKLVVELQPERDASRSPLFQTMFNLQPHTAGHSATLPGLELRPLDFEHGTVKFDLELSMEDWGDTLVGRFNFNCDLFERATIERMTLHFQTLLGALAVKPALPVAQVPLLSAAEQQLLLSQGQGRKAAYADLCLHQLFELQAAKTPERLAVVAEQGTLTYRELNEQANAIAHRLQQAGIGAESLVGIYMERTPSMLAAMLGVLKAGGAYVPLDPAYPQDRILYTMQDANMAMLVTENALLAELPPHDVPALCLPLPDAGQVDNPVSGVTSRNLAYVIYTSGSTGRPKGVAIEHRSAATMVQWAQEEYTAEDLAGVLFSTSICFDLSVYELFVTLRSGGKVIVAENALQLPQLAARNDVTLINTVPSAIAELLRQQTIPASVRTVNLAGEALPLHLVQQLYQLGTVQNVYNLYGPSEDTTYSTYTLVDHTAATAPTIGRPLVNTDFYLLDAHMQLVPPGVSGQLYLAGDGLARGYLGQEALTAEKFVPNPFADEPNARMYATGDLARLLPDGNLEYLGRLDHQVKVRGYRIELGEIEEVLVRHPSVRAALAIVREDIPGNKRIVAYLAADAADVPTEELRALLKELLPDYMIPSALVTLEAFPLTANGKIDRKALPAPDFSADAANRYAPPRNETEAALAEIWAQVLRVERVGIEDNFFALGGDSILSIQILHLATQRGIRFTPKDLFQYQTIAELSHVVSTGHTTVSAEQGVVTGDVLLTPAQHWFFEQQQADAHHFNLPFLLTLRERAEEPTLRQALAELLSHHDALRMRYVHTADGWQQENAGVSDEVPLVLVDLSHAPQDEQEQRFVTEANSFQAGLELDGRLVQAVLFDFGADRPQRLLLVVHHLVVDGVSWRILLQDLETLYGQLLRGEQAELPPKTTSFREWAERLTEAAQSQAVTDEQSYWLQLAEHAPSALPLDRADAANTSGSTRTVTVTLTQEETKQLLQEAPQAYNTQINDLLLTALAQAFAGWTGDNKLLVNFEGHGREDISDSVDTSRTVGWFTSIYPVCLQLSGQQTPGDAIKAVKEQLRAIPNKGIGYGLLRYLHHDEQLRQAMAAIPTPEVSFNYLGQFDTGTAGADTMFQLAGHPSGSAHSERMTRSHLLDITGLVAGDQLRLNLIYSANAHDAATIEEVGSAFLAELRALIAHCLSPEAGGFTPSDFPEARTTQNELDAFLADLGDRAADMEQLYELSPLQQGMLFHSLLAANEGFYVTQLNLEVQGALDADVLQQAWNSVLQRHSILRTAFFWHESAKPLQAVFKTVTMPFAELDWRGQTPEQQEAALQQFLLEDTKRGFEMTAAPLMRITLIRLGDNVQRLIWTSHHLLLDGWSTSVVFQEMFAAYRASATGQSLQGRAPRPYRDFIHWLQAQDEQAAERYWRGLLAGFIAPTSLRVDTHRTSLEAEEQRFNEQKALLSAELTQSLQAFGKQHQLTLNTLVQGAWALLLSRYSGEADVTFGTTVSGRPTDLAGVDTMVGMFINTLPIRQNLPGETPLIPYLQALQNQQAEMRQYEYTPLMSVQSWSDVPRGVPLFETIFVFENYPADEKAAESAAGADDLQISAAATREQTNYPITVTVIPGSQIGVKLAYDRLRFDDDTIERMTLHLQTLLTEMVQAADLPVQTLRILSHSEEQQLADWNDNPRPYPHHLCAHELFDRQAAATPERTALVFAGESMTYRELEAASNRLARQLQAQGVAPGLFVGYFGERTLEWAVAVLAIFKAGGIYVPLDPKYPQDRLAFMIEDTKPQVMLTSRQFAGMLPAHQAQVICLDDMQELIEQQSANTPDYAVTPNDRAYVIFTSGSTGRPKGAMVEHKGMVNHLLAKVDELQVTREDRIAQNSSQCVDISVWQLLTAWMVGGSTHVLPDEVAFDPGNQLDEMERSRLTVVETVPSLLRAMIDEVTLRDPHRPDLTALRWMIPNGEVLPPELCRKWLAYYPDAWLINAYGPTECSDDVTHHFISEPPGEEITNISIGRVIPNMKLYVLDKAMQFVPIGVPGELHIGGIGVGPGYLNDPEKTAKSFLSDFITGQAGARLYKTGDLVRFRPDGLLEFLGRIDNQVKIRGFRIEIGEIETVLSNHETVEEAVVIAREDTPGDKRLAAYLTAAPDAAIDTAELREHAKSKLPAHMVPAAFVVLDILPLTANGKINRRALPKPDDADVVRENEYLAPRDETEQRLAEIWAQLLGLSEVGITDNFFALGGHSLLAVRLMSEVQKEFGQKLALQALYQGGTIEGLADALRQASQELPSSLVEVQRGTDADRKPLFLVHAGGGMVHTYVELARQLGAEHTVYGLQSQGVEEGETPLTTIEAMAAHYIAAIRFVQPEGPYLLGGWSLGGVVAYEMARQLREQGELAADVFLLDTAMPTWQQDRPQQDAKDFALMFANNWARQLGEDLSELLQQRETLSEQQILDYVFEQGRARQLFPPDLDQAAVLRGYHVFKNNIMAQQAYAPQPYDGRLTLLIAQESADQFVAKQSVGYVLDTTLGWGQVAQTVISHQVSGEHSTLMEQPAVQGVAQCLRLCLQDLTVYTSK
ncbi:non-ribosomal peptide synthase/polyketide synthase [Tumebacillus avium]|nr:non-ribosomal peptide synthetase [Tumebacillus avium]